jgi:hypothetical protein
MTLMLLLLPLLLLPHRLYLGSRPVVMSCGLCWSLWQGSLYPPLQFRSTTRRLCEFCVCWQSNLLKFMLAVSCIWTSSQTTSW